MRWGGGKKGVGEYRGVVVRTPERPPLRADAVERSQKLALRLDNLLAKGAFAIERHPGSLALLSPLVNLFPPLPSISSPLSSGGEGGQGAEVRVSLGWHGICLKRPIAKRRIRGT